MTYVCCDHAVTCLSGCRCHIGSVCFRVLNQLHRFNAVSRSAILHCRLFDFLIISPMLTQQCSIFQEHLPPQQCPSRAPPPPMTGERAMHSMLDGESLGVTRAAASKLLPAVWGGSQPFLSIITFSTVVDYLCGLF